MSTTTTPPGIELAHSAGELLAGIELAHSAGELLAGIELAHSAGELLAGIELAHSAGELLAGGPAPSLHAVIDERGGSAKASRQHEADRQHKGASRPGPAPHHRKEQAERTPNPPVHFPVLFLLGFRQPGLRR